MFLLRQYLVTALFVGSVVGFMFLLIALGVPVGYSPLVGFIITVILWWFVTRKLRRYRIVQIMFNVDNHSVLRDE